MKKRILSILLCLVMVVGLLPTAAFAAETTDTEYKSAATKIKFYSEDGKKTLKTLSKGQTYTVDGKTVAEYTADGVLTLTNYNGGPIEAWNGSLEMKVNGTNTITSSGAKSKYAISLNSDTDESHNEVGPTYLMAITGEGTDPSITFVLNGMRSRKCFGYSNLCNIRKTVEGLKITATSDDKGKCSLEVQSLKNCTLETINCEVTAAGVDHCSVTATELVWTYAIENNSTVKTPKGVEVAEIKDSTVEAKYLRHAGKDLMNNWINCVKTTGYNLAELARGSEDGITIENSTVTLTGNSSTAWSIDEPAIGDFYFGHEGTGAPQVVNEAGITIKNSTVTITNHTYGIISPMRGVLIENSKVTVDALCVALGVPGTKTYGYSFGGNKYGLKVEGSSQVKLTAHENLSSTTSYTSNFSLMGTMALGYVQDGSTPANNFDLDAGGFVELTTNAFNRAPAAEFPATLGENTKVVDGAIDGGYVVATKTDSGYQRYNKTTGANETVYTYTARIEGIKPAMTGEIKYQGAAIFGQQIKASVTGAPTDATVKYQWQIKNGDTWEDISGATNAYLQLWGDTWASRVDKEIRVIAYADNCDGQLIGAALTLTKKTPTTAPDAPQLTTNAKDDNTTTVEILNYKSDLEYVYTTSPAGDSWPSGTPISGNSFDVDLTSNVQTIYVYARFKATDSSEAGVKFAGSSVLIPAKSGSTTYARDMIYPDYDTKMPTIYLKKGDSITVKYQISPDDATSNLPQWASSYTSTDGKNVTATVSNDTTSKTLTIKAGTTVGTVSVKAYKDLSASYLQPWYGSSPEGATDGRTINVVIYDKNDLANAPFTRTYLGTVNLYEGDTYDVETSDLLALDFVPADVNKSGYTLKAMFTTHGMTGGTTYSDTNDYVGLSSDTEKFTITGNDKTSSAAVITFFALPDSVTETTSYGKYAIASMDVTVSARPTVAVESIKVAPNALTLRMGDTFTLTATKNPTSADGTITWESSNTANVTVTADTSNSAKATVRALDTATAGTYTITATCNGKEATCTVEVLAAECATHTKTYTYTSSDMHLWTCSVCGAYGSEKHTGTCEKVDNDTHKITCSLCMPENSATEDHIWVQDGDPVAATLTAGGYTNYECSKCKATKKDDETLKLEAISSVALTVTAPAVGGTATQATTTATNCAVALTEWADEAGNDVYIDDTFVSGKTYTVKVALEAKDNNVFTDSTTFTVNDKTASVVTRSAESVTLTYTFPKLSGSSSSSSSGGGSSVSTYTITVEDAKNGDVTADRKSASSGTTVIVTVDPDKGYTLETLIVLDKSGKEVKLTDKGNGKYTFKMPASKVTVKATFMDDNTMLNFFVDVPADAYFADAVLWAAENGITGGIDATHFAPYATCTRAQAVTFLWRAAGCPAPKSSEMPFTDVPVGSYCYDAVLWAVENGITKGTTDTTFTPNAECSRAQIVTFLWRSQKSPAIDAANPFTDVSAEAYYASAVLWAAANGITGGTTATTFSPNANCTRAQIVTFIYRCMK